MKAITHSRSGDESVLALTDLEMPEPGPGEVRIRIIVSGVNPTDWKSRRSRSAADTTRGEKVPNQDGAGIVDAVGPGVTELAVGNRVWVVLAAYQRPLGGTAQEYAVVPIERTFHLPPEASFESGASVGIPGVTAHRALTVGVGAPTRLHQGALERRVVLVSGGAGAVGNAAIQLAHWAGARVIATVSSPEKAALARAAGADAVVNYRDSDAVAQIREHAPGGVHTIVEVALDHNVELDLQVVATGGTIASYAYSGDGSVIVPIGRSMGLNVGYEFVLLYTLPADFIAQAAADINAALVDGALAIGEAAGLPIHRFALAQTASAHRAVEDGAVGKVLIEVGSDAAS